MPEQPHEDYHMKLAEGAQRWQRQLRINDLSVHAVARTRVSSSEVVNEREIKDGLVRAQMGLRRVLNATK